MISYKSWILGMKVGKSTLRTKKNDLLSVTTASFTLIFSLKGISNIPFREIKMFKQQYAYNVKIFILFTLC